MSSGSSGNQAAINADPGPPPVIPPPPASSPPPPETGDVTGGVIPYKNPHALAAYYTGVFSIIPCVGFLLACVAVPLGISGLRQRAKRPIIRGSVHAWVGIILGSISILAHLALLITQIAVGLGHR